MGNALPRQSIHGLSIVLLLLIAAGGASAFPCERSNYVDDCQTVWNANLPETEKEVVTASMITDTKTWNRNIPHGTTPPENTTTVSTDIVKNAWVRILSITPSAYDNDTLLSPGYGELQVRYHFDIQQPSGTERGDCKTVHKLQYDSQTTTYLNGLQIGTGETIPYTANADMTFVSQLAVNTEHTLQHYRWKRVKRSLICAYSSTEIRQVKTLAQDRVSARLHRPSMSYSFIVQDEYDGVHQITFNATNDARFRLQFAPDAFYEESTRHLEPFFTLKPYYARQYMVVLANTTASRNVWHNNGTYWTTALDGCTITLGDLFQNQTYPCNTSIQASTPNEPRATYNPNVSAWKAALELSSTVLISYLIGKTIVKLVGGTYDLWNS